MAKKVLPSSQLWSGTNQTGASTAPDETAKSWYELCSPVPYDFVNCMWPIDLEIDCAAWYTNPYLHKNRSVLAKTNNIRAIWLGQVHVAHGSCAWLCCLIYVCFCLCWHWIWMWYQAIEQKEQPVSSCVVMCCFVLLSSWILYPAVLDFCTSSRFCADL